MKTLMMFAVALSLGAQDPPRPPGPPPAFDAIQEYLSLNDSQAAQLKQLMRSRAEGNRARLREMNARHRQLADLLQQGASDAATVGRLMLEVESYRKQVRSADDGFLTEASSLLDETQRAKLKALQEASKLMPAVHEARALGLLPDTDGHAPNGPAPMRRPGPPTRAPR